eukprot:2988853-Heterocapsa_arctica.AAC.1
MAWHCIKKKAFACPPQAPSEGKTPPTKNNACNHQFHSQIVRAYPGSRAACQFHWTNNRVFRRAVLPVHPGTLRSRMILFIAKSSDAQFSRNIP